MCGCDLVFLVWAGSRYRSEFAAAGGAQKREPAKQNKK